MNERNFGFDPDTTNLDEQDRRPSAYHEGLKRKMREMVSKGTDGSPEGQALNKAIDDLEKQEREDGSITLS